MLYAIGLKNGGVKLMKLVEGTDPHAEVAKWAPEDQGEVASIVEISEGDVPRDRSKRAKWSLQGGKVVALRS